jgi:acetyl esterase/lipase
VTRRVALTAPCDDDPNHRSVESDPPADTPPVFLLHAGDDSAVPVENSMNLYLALRERQLPVVMRLFESGGHGFGLRGLESRPLRVVACTDEFVV